MIESLQLVSSQQAESPNLDGEHATPSELQMAAEAEAEKKKPVVKVTLPGPVGPLDSHPDNVRQFCQTWMKPTEAPVASTSVASTGSPTGETTLPGHAPPAAAPTEVAATSTEVPKAALPEVAAAAPTEVAKGTSPQVPAPAPTQVVKNGPDVLNQLPAIEAGIMSAEPSADEMSAELEALMDQSRSLPAPAVAPTGDEPQPGSKINWSTRKNEGMRLTRMMDSNGESFPHMKKLWDSNKKDRVVLISNSCVNL